MKLQGVWVALLVTLSAQASTTFTLRCAGRPAMQVSLMDGGLMTMGWSGQFYVGHEGGRRRLPSGDVVRWYRLQNGDELWRDNTRGRDFLSYVGSGRLTPCQSGPERKLEAQSLPRVPG